MPPDTNPGNCGVGLLSTNLILSLPFFNLMYFYAAQFCAVLLFLYGVRIADPMPKEIQGSLHEAVRPVHN